MFPELRTLPTAQKFPQSYWRQESWALEYIFHTSVHEVLSATRCIRKYTTKIVVLYTFSLMLSALPISVSSNWTQAMVPSHEHAIITKPSKLQVKSKTESLNSSLMMTRGRLSAVNQMDSDRSLEPMAQQQYCWGLLMCGRDFSIMLLLNLCKIIQISSKI